MAVPFSVSNEQPVSYFRLHDNVLIEKLDLILEISPDHFLEHPDVGQIASLIKDDLHLFSWEETIIDEFQGWIAAEHLEVEMLPLFTNAGKFALAFLHS